MFADVVVIHRPGGQSEKTLADDLLNARDSSGGIGEFFFWQTCLRQIAIVERRGFEAIASRDFVRDEIFLGDRGYAFLLEVICGLHSPLTGETEVYGQFKNAVAAFSIPNSFWGSQLRRFFRVLFEDAKRIRLKHLEDLGSQSYGSLLRKELKGLRQIDVLGAGRLVAEFLPWIKKDANQIRVYSRDPIKARRELAEARAPEVPIHRLLAAEDAVSCEALVIAAPVSNEWLSTWLQSRPNISMIIDLRADSNTNRVVFGTAQVLALGDFFARLSENQALIARRKAAALSAIDAAVRERSSYVENRPFGWEDVCA